MIGSYILSGRYQAIVSTVLSTLISSLSFFMLPFAYLISGTVIVLITLRKGMRFGLQTILGSLLVLQLFAFLAGLPLSLGFTHIAVVWLPVWLAAGILRMSESQGILLLAVGILAIILVLIGYFLIDDMVAWWQQGLDMMLEKMVSPDQAEYYLAVFQPVMELMNAMVAVGFMLNIFNSVLLGRWWQSKLFNPGGFRKEFYGLRLSPLMLPVNIIVILMMFTVSLPWNAIFKDIFIIMLAMYMIQGISSVHRNVDKYTLSMGWLITMYILLITFPIFGLLISFLGITDIYIDWCTKNRTSEIK